MTFEDDLIGVGNTSSKGEDYTPYQPHHRVMMTMQAPSISSDDDSSLTSSHWALMQYDVPVLSVAGEKDDDVDDHHHHQQQQHYWYRHSTPWNQDTAESLVLQLLDTSLTTLSPPYNESSKTVKDRDILMTSDVEPNVSWSEEEEEDDDDDDENSSKGNLRQDSAEKHTLDSQCVPSYLSVSSPKRHGHENNTNGHRSPFTTFRCNSTSIALDETEIYLRKIHQLETKLAEAQNQLVQERKQRVVEPMPSVGNESIPQISNLRTPASTHPNSILRRCRSFSDAATTPFTPSSTMSTKTTAENLWERNKTLVTEIRFADQTCVELAHQKSSLQAQLEEMQTKCHNLETMNTKLLLDHESAKASTIAAETEVTLLRQQLAERQNTIVHEHTLESEHRMKNLVQENTDLIQELHDAREQIATLRDEIIENFESYKDETSELKDQIHQLVSKWNNESLKHESEQISQQQLHELMEENDTLRHEISDRDAIASNERNRTVKMMQRAMDAMTVQYDTLQSTMIRKLGNFDHRFDSLCNTVRYMEDAIIQCEDENDDDDDDDDVADPTRDNNIQPVIMECTTMESTPGNHSDCVNATFTSEEHRRRRLNETMDLAMMEEARADVVIHSGIMGDVQSPVLNDGDDSPSQHHYHFDGLSRVLSERDFSSPSGEKSEFTENENGLYNSKFLQHVQWLATSNTAKQAPPNDESNDQSADLIKSRALVPSQFHRDLKCLRSNLSYSESENSSIQDERESDTTKEHITLDQINTLRHTNQVVSSMLDESLEHISKLNEIVIVHERSVLLQEESLVMEKLVVETEIKMVDKAIEQAHNSMTNAPSIDDAVQYRNLDSLQEDKNNLVEQLAFKSRELQNASEQIGVLKNEAIKREKLMMRFETLRNEKEDADKLLREKCIVPRRMNSETNKLVEDLYDKIDKFRDELRISTQKVETLTNKFELVEAEKTKQIAELNQSLQLAVEERDTLHQEVARLLQMKDTLLVDNDSQQQLIEEKNNEIEKMKEATDRLERQLEGSKIEVNELKNKLQRNEEIQVANSTLLERIQQERSSLTDHVARMTETQKQFENEKHRLESKLVDCKQALTDAENVSAAKEWNTALLENKIKGFVSELQIATETNDVYAEALRKASEFRLSTNFQLEVQANELLTCHERMESLEQELHHTNALLGNSNDEITVLHRTNDNLVAKCTKLREYIRKVTKKCHEWEIYHDRESAAVKHLHHAYDQTCRKAYALSTICKEKDQVRS